MATRCSWSRPLSLTCGCLLLLVLGGPGVFQSHAVEVEVKDSSNTTCIYAKWMMSFLIKYETNSSEYKNVTLEPSTNVTHKGSTCGNKTHDPLLAIQFGAGHSWSLNFTKTNETYRGNIITFTYNTSDVAFKDAKKKEVITIVANDTLHPVRLNTVYRCHHLDSVEVANVSQFFWNVTLQAFVQNGTVSKNDSICDADKPTVSTTVMPTIANFTSLPSTTASSPSPTTTSKPAEKPFIGNYSLKNGGKTCLLATIGLQLNASQEKPALININPKTTAATGSCGNTSATLQLNDSNRRFIDFTFALKNTSGNVPKFYLREVNVTLISFVNGSEPLNAGNNNLSLWDTFLGSSYMCQKEQSVVVTEDLQIHTFDLRIQPFRVEDDRYSKAEECFADSDLNFLIPIAVGVALGFLIILVFISYVIGRRKSRTGYQSV
ncbi:lysosome-associated membrane glycoprotein 2 isoform X2 [Pelodiscus sinensis]|uniref:lysosome-associated membrane glycoprotein 2 isoform X2 n=1 Tax=Pelodiscus sinensis TaxID=13735 RepID=UPI0003C43B90|nr:lysosome-associated membrane glycoprotein 2 isoform X2 [Pelodiscus sinensis]|eukprot:XP_006115463.1 lysosome-associated membrane glycoprotein 2 isoform X2 [Pelodiscus sinensis]